MLIVFLLSAVLVEVADVQAVPRATPSPNIHFQYAPDSAYRSTFPTATPSISPEPSPSTTPVGR